MNFNLEDYEPVEERLARFHEKYPEGRVITEIEEYTEDTVVFKAYLYKKYEDERPTSTGFAAETRDKELKKTSSGKEYESVNFTSHLENCETSAIGRALANAGFAPKGKRPSREEMKKVASPVIAKKTTKQVIKKDQKKTEEEIEMEGLDELMPDEPVRDTKGHLYCESCGKVISLRVEKYSGKEFGKRLCMNCQIKERKNK